MIKFILVINKQGQQRLVKYYEDTECKQRFSQELEIIKSCIMKTDQEANFFDYKTSKIVYRKYATLYFIIGIDHDENEMAVFEFIRNIVETLDKYFDKVCELDIMFNLDRVHMILDEMILNGRIVESNKAKILAPIQLMDQVVKK